MESEGKSESLTKELRSGKIETYENLMDTYYQKLCAYAFTLSNDHADAEDIVQNVFTRLWMKRKKITPDFSTKGFLYKAVYNEFVDQYRKNKHLTSLEAGYLETLETVVQNEPENLETLIKWVYSTVENLPPKCRHIFLLNKREGLTHIEISEYMGISLKTVEWHITHAFKLLREKLNSNTGPMMFLLFGLRKPGTGDGLYDNNGTPSLPFFPL